MRADYLLEMLQRCQIEGSDLSTLDVVVRYTKYDPSIPYDMGVDEFTYPEDVGVNGSELVLG